MKKENQRASTTSSSEPIGVYACVCACDCVCVWSVWCQWRIRFGEGSGNCGELLNVLLMMCKRHRDAHWTVNFTVRRQFASHRYLLTGERTCAVDKWWGEEECGLRSQLACLALAAVMSRWESQRRLLRTVVSVMSRSSRNRPCCQLPPTWLASSRCSIKRVPTTVAETAVYFLLNDVVFCSEILLAVSVCVVVANFNLRRNGQLKGKI